MSYTALRGNKLEPFKLPPGHRFIRRDGGGRGGKFLGGGIGRFAGARDG